jgi:hypothetical protein
MKITIGKLRELGACRDGRNLFEGQDESDLVVVVEKLKLKETIEHIEDKYCDNSLAWANWIVSRMMSYTQRVKYAVYAAEQVIDIYEKKYPDDDRPRKAIEAAKKCIESPTEENKAAAAADAAAYAAYADAAAYAAYADAAAYVAADAAAAYAAYVAAYADAAYADAAAAYAAYAADAKKEMMIKILDYGVEIIKSDDK